jgi:hypothetical protein
LAKEKKEKIAEELAKPGSAKKTRHQEEVELKIRTAECLQKRLDRAAKNKEEFLNGIKGRIKEHVSLQRY